MELVSLSMSNSKLPLHAQYWGYVERYIPAANWPLLSKELDGGDDTEAHKIVANARSPRAHYTREEVHAITEEVSKIR